MLQASAGRTVTVYHRQHTTRHKQTVRQRARKRDNERARTKGRENVATTNDRKRERNRNYTPKRGVVCSLSRAFIAPTSMYVCMFVCICVHALESCLPSRASHVSFARLLPKSRQACVACSVR